MPRSRIKARIIQRNSKKTVSRRRLFFWRRRRDSNPRDAFDAYAISSRAPSTKLGDFSISIFAPRGGQPHDDQQI